MQLSEQARKQRNAYMRKWRAKPKNKIKTREYNKTYWERRAIKELQKEET